MKGFTTKVIHNKPQREDAHGALRFPVYDCAAYEFESAEEISQAFMGQIQKHAYTRVTNPTVEFFEQQIKSATGALSVLALSSGMAAISNTILALCSSGDNIVSSSYLFGNTVTLFEETLKPWGLEARFTDFTNPSAVEALIDDKTRVLFLETVTNPQLQVADIDVIGKIAKKHGVVLVVDSTITPLVFADLKSLGVAIEVISSTKYISGGGTSIGGLIIDYGTYDWREHPRYSEDFKKFGPMCFYRKLKKTIFRIMGATLSPHNAYLQSLGLETFMLRVRKSCENALAIAQFLEKHKDVAVVNYPGLPKEENQVARRQFGDLFGGLLTFDLESKEACFQFMDRLKVIRRATNLNDNKTLVIHPASTIYCEFSQEKRELMGVGESTIRLAVGIEDLDDLIDDINDALSV